MNVLAISASPRKGGNSDVLCDEFLKGAAEKGHAVQKIRLAEKKIAPCLACYGCTQSHVCVQRDGMAEVLGALKAADVIALASPVYFYSVCAQMKTMIDRCLADYRAIRDKTFYLIVTAAVRSTAPQRKRWQISAAFCAACRARAKPAWSMAPAPGTRATYSGTLHTIRLMKWERSFETWKTSRRTLDLAACACR